VKKKFTWDLILFYKVRNFKDGITFLEFICNLDLYKGDHKPEFKLHIIILNWTIIEFNIYNIYHKD